MAKIINGRLVSPIPDGGISGNELIEAARAAKPKKPNRRIVLQDGIHVEEVKPARRYTKRQLISKKTGQPVRVKDMADRTIGASQTYGQPRDPLSKRIILEQILNVSEKFYTDKLVEFDEDDCNWVIFPNFVLPDRWQGIARRAHLLISFPMEYPTLPPVGFYLNASLPRSPNGHFYNAAYHSADKSPLEEDWKWFCAYIDPQNWCPAHYRNPGDWEKGDNLWDYLTLIHEALNNDD